MLILCSFKFGVNLFPRLRSHIINNVGEVIWGHSLPELVADVVCINARWSEHSGMVYLEEGRWFHWLNWEKVIVFGYLQMRTLLGFFKQVLWNHWKRNFTPSVGHLKHIVYPYRLEDQMTLINYYAQVFFHSCCQTCASVRSECGREGDQGLWHRRWSAWSHQRSAHLWELATFDSTYNSCL